MTLETQFQQQLNALGVGREATLAVDDPPRRLECRVTQSDSLAVTFTELRLSTAELAGASVSDLQRLSEAISRRLTYLLEPIAPIEADADQCIVQMRSQPPQKDDDGRSYYELLVRRGGDLSLVRYSKQPGAARMRIDATLTREVLVRLARDWNEALDEYAG